jgi:uncharacterized membrane protein YdbT with pleckstrin-like domain
MNFWPPQMVPQPKIRDHLLRDEGEVIVDEVAHHWVAYTKAMLWAALGILLLVAALFVNVDLALFVLLLGAAALLWASYLALDVHLDRFVVTNMRVFRVHGVFAQSLATVPLSRILDITVSKPLLGRIFGYGHFVFESAAQEQGLREIRLVGRPDQRDLTIQRVVQRAGLRKRA